jgi:riboflavin kinase/FMN adenylyltransferase
MTMRPHPREFFAPHAAPNLLTADGKKDALLAEAGIQALFYLPFDRRTADTEPERFIAEIIQQRSRAVAVVAGHDCRFGKRARGDANSAPRTGSPSKKSRR